MLVTRVTLMFIVFFYLHHYIARLYVILFSANLSGAAHGDAPHPV